MLVDEFGESSPPAGDGFVRWGSTSALATAAFAVAVPSLVLFGRPPQLAVPQAVQGAALSILILLGASAIARSSITRRCRWRPLAYGAYVVVILGFVVAVGTVYVAMFTTIPWRARVISVGADKVCTVVDEGERDQGWTSPFCLRPDASDGFVDESGQQVVVRVGDCVKLEVRHPGIYVVGRVTCHV